MGFFDRLKARARGVMTAAKPEKGVPPASETDVRDRLLSISGSGIETSEQDNDIVVSWSAKVASLESGGADYEYRYRAIRISLDAGEHTATGICLKTTTERELDASAPSAHKDWERGQYVGSEKMIVLAWLGPHHVEGGATEQGYTFNWSDLRAPVITAVTGAGWTYKPKTI
jgi:hypothetical protein